MDEGELWQRESRVAESVLNFQTCLTREVKVFLTEELIWREINAFEENKNASEDAFLPWHSPVSNSTLRGNPEIHDPLSEHWKT